MANLVELGLRFFVTGEDKVNKTLDDFAQKSYRAEQANESLQQSFRQTGVSAAASASGIKTASQAMDAMVGDLMRGAREELKFAQGARQLTMVTQQAAGSAQNMGRSVGGLRGALRTAASGFMNFARGVRDGMSAEIAFANSHKRVVQSLNATSASHAVLQGNMRKTSMLAANMGNQFADVGVQLAMGMNPLMILVQQGPQIANVFAMAKAQGVSMGQVFGNLGRMLGPLTPAVTALGVAGAAAFGSILLGIRSINQEKGDLTTGMNLTKDQLDELKEAGVSTSVTLRDAFVGSFNYIAKAAEPILSPLKAFFSDLFDTIAKNTWNDVKVIVTAFVKAKQAIVFTFSNLPAAVGDIVAATANNVLRIIEGMINRVGGALNGLAGKVNAGAKMVGLGGLHIGNLGSVSLGRVANPNEGAAATYAARKKAAEDAAVQGALATLDGIRTGMRKSWEKAGQDRIKKALDEDLKKASGRHGGGGRGGRGRAGDTGPDPLEMQMRAEEKMAQLAAQLAGAKQEEVRAQLALTQDVFQRAGLEQKLIRLEAEQRNAQIDRQIVQIKRDQDLTDADKKNLIAQQMQIKAINNSVAQTQERAATEEAIRLRAKENLDLEMNRREETIKLLQAQRDGAKTESERAAFDVKILAAQQEAELYHLEQIQKRNGYSDQEIALAKETLKLLPARHEAERKALKNQRGLEETFGEVRGAMESAANAFKDHDWGGGLMDLAAAIETTIAAMNGAGDKFGAFAGLVGGLGKMIGGKFGNALSSGASGAIGGFKIGSQISGLLGGGLSFLGPVGAVAGGLFGFLGGIFGGNKQKRAERRAREQEEAEKKAQKAQEIAQEKRELELRLIEATGDQVRILAAQRDKELQEVNEANRELLKQVHEAEDRQKRFEKLRDIEIDMLRLSGNELAALNKERQREQEAIDATLRPIMDLVYAAQDAADAVDQAKQALQDAYDAELTKLEDAVTKAHDELADAYDREATSLQDVIDRTKDLAKELRDFRKSLDTDTSALSPENAYNAARTRYINNRNLAMMGDQNAQSQFVEFAEAFKQASGDMFGFGPEYFRDIENIKRDTDRQTQIADKQVDRAEAQLTALNQLVNTQLQVLPTTISVRDALYNLETAQQALQSTQAIVNPLLGINQGVMTLSQAIANYQAAVANQAAATLALAQAVAQAQGNPANQLTTAPNVSTSLGYTSTNGDYSAYVRGNADLLALFNAHKGMAKGRTMEEFGLYHWANFGQTENRQVRAFAAGGEFTASGYGSTDSKRYAMDLSPWETATVKPSAMMSREAEAQERQAEALDKLCEKVAYLVQVQLHGNELVIEQTRRADENNAKLGTAIETSKRREAR